MEKLNEQDLLNWLKEMNVDHYVKNTMERRTFDIHYIFKINDIKYSIVSWNQYPEKQLKEYREMGLNMEENEPIWEIYCSKFDMDIKRSNDLNNFKEYINECEKKNGDKYEQ